MLMSEVPLFGRREIEATPCDGRLRYPQRHLLGGCHQVDDNLPEDVKLSDKKIVIKQVG